MWSQPITTGTSKARAGHSLVPIGTKLYAFGGSDGKNFCNDLQVLDLETMSWSTPLTTGPVPEPRSRHTCTALHTRLVFIGGGDQSRLFNDVHLYDCETREWSVVRAKGKAPSGRWGHSTTLVDSNKLFVFGGHDGKVRLNDLFILHLDTMTWSQPGKKKKRRNSLGSANNSSSGTVTSPVDDTTHVKQPPPPRAGHTMNMIGRKLIIYGGGDGKSLNDMHYLNVDTFQWFEMESGNVPERCAHTADNAANNRLVVFGGSNGIKTFNDIYVVTIGKHKLRKNGRRASLTKSDQPLNLSGEMNNTNEVTPVTEPPPPPPRPLPLTLDSPDSEQSHKHTQSSLREKELYDWLSALGLIKYFTLFFREELWLDVVPLMTDDMLTQLGVTDFHDRLTLLRHIETLRHVSQHETKHVAPAVLDDMLTRVEQLTQMMTEHVTLLKTVASHTIPVNTNHASSVNGHANHVSEKVHRVNSFDQWHAHTPKS